MDRHHITGAVPKPAMSSGGKWPESWLSGLENWPLSQVMYVVADSRSPPWLLGQGKAPRKSRLGHGRARQR